ncbi:response regulator [Cupriavidus pampae]|uniref:Alkaline phosphatase synthesis transcriptional regulatory protein PhoP n=1 Tax=Cupriavidus pampae TaxID=659251 RepID=A0ABN7ZNB6_9BURK|nr:response regulator [Cupriavidus pampae]CAG9185624.1 Alkaline phosphatase synthesis transcriptional regulatory protein PhoP [Cupriavidus pampae]
MATVVVVDDESINADALAVMLSMEGIRAITAADGAEGLRIIAAEVPDAVITDFMMPVMSGFEMAVAMRADSLLSKIPLVLLTAAQAEIGHCHPDLFDAVFEKPCVPARIIARLFELMAKSA